MVRGPESANPSAGLNEREQSALDSIKEPARNVFAKLGELAARVHIDGVLAVDSAGRPLGPLIAGMVQHLQSGEKPVLENIQGGMPPSMIHDRVLELSQTIPRGASLLLVDDTYSDGRTADPLDEELRKFGYRIHVVVLHDEKSNLLKKHPDAVYGVQGVGSNIHKMPTLSGVRKGRGLHAEVLKSVPGVPKDVFESKVTAAQERIQDILRELIVEREDKK